VTDEITIVVGTALLVAAVPLLRALGERFKDKGRLPLIGLGLTIVGGIVLVWTMLRIAARELK
jgi:hypothetical protein